MPDAMPAHMPMMRRYFHARFDADRHAFDYLQDACFMMPLRHCLSTLPLISVSAILFII